MGDKTTKAKGKRSAPSGAESPPPTQENKSSCSTAGGKSAKAKPACGACEQQEPAVTLVKGKKFAWGTKKSEQSSTHISK